MKELQDIIDGMAPDEALAVLVQAAKKLLAHLDERAKADFVVSMIGGTGADKVAAMVDL